NMVYQSYLRVMEKYNKDIDGPFNLKIETNIPIARGLGSSSTCILAGIVAANIYGQLNLSPQQIAYEACLVEGHPDNVAPAALGGMVSAVLDDNDIYYHRVEVANNLSFYALIGLEELSTSKARAALPTELTYAQAIHNIARASICLNAFEKGIINYLPIVSQDQIHQEYRMNLICNIEQIRNIIASNKFITHWVSGAGTTMMFLGETSKDSELQEYIKSFDDLDFRKLSVDYSGVMVEYY
ncbi:MAG: homoserine kinase, partial [Erysipelotrichales bacterium]